MGFDFPLLVESGAGRIFSSPFVRSVCESPVLVALLLTAIAVVIFLGSFYAELKDKKKKMLRCGIYFSLFAFIVFCLHDKCLLFVTDAKNDNSAVRQNFNAIEEIRRKGEGLAISPGVVFGAGETEHRAAPQAALALDDVDMPFRLI